MTPQAIRLFVADFSALSPLRFILGVHAFEKPIRGYFLTDPFGSRFGIYPGPERGELKAKADVIDEAGDLIG